MVHDNNTAKRILDNIKSKIEWKYSDGGFLFNLARVQFALKSKNKKGHVVLIPIFTPIIAPVSA